MHNLLVVIAMIVAVGVLYVVMPVVVGAYRRYRRPRLVTCPETHQAAAVQVDAGHAALTATLHDVDLRLSSCSRWPERHDCGQECLRQIEAAPDDCVVRTIVARWYEGKHCVLCGQAFAFIESWGHTPALMGPDGETVEWGDVEMAKLPELLRSHRPVCWNCHVAETFRREHPDLVIEAPQHTVH